MQLCDTNVLSELTRREPNAGVLAWASEQTTMALSVVTLDEVYYGLAWRPIPRILGWFEHFVVHRCDILPITAEVTWVSGQLRGRFQAQGETRSQADMMIAGTAQVHGLTLVTRNLEEFRGCGISILNPFT